jgi:hypothetical protein
VVAAQAGRLLGLRVHVLDIATGQSLDEEIVSATEFATVGTSMSEEGWVYVPGFSGGVWGFEPDPN